MCQADDKERDFEREPDEEAGPHDDLRSEEIGEHTAKPCGECSKDTVKREDKRDLVLVEVQVDHVGREKSSFDAVADIKSRRPR